MAILGVSVAGAATSEPPRLADLAMVDPMVAARIEEVWQAAAAEPADPSRWLVLAEVYHAHDLTGLAEECYFRATELAPDDPKMWYLLALAQYDLGEPVAAIQSLNRVLNLTQSYAPAFWRRGRWLLEQGGREEAETAFRRATEIDSSDVAGWVGVARVLIARGEPRQAVDILFNVLAADPNNGVAGQLLGNAFRAMGDKESARRALTMGTGMGAYFPDPWQEEMLAQATGVGNQLRLLSAKLERGEVDSVIAELEKLRTAHPRDVGVLNKLSEGYLHKRELDAALETLQVALEVDPGEFATLMHLAETQKFRGDLPGALVWADRAIDANPGHWQAYFERAGILGQMGRHADCLEAIDAAMGLGAIQNPNAWLMQGDILLRLGDWARAGTAFEQATTRFPFLGPAFLGLAIARTEEGRWTEARSALAVARQMQQDDQTVAAIQARIDTDSRPTE